MNRSEGISAGKLFTNERQILTYNQRAVLVINVFSYTAAQGRFMLPACARHQKKIQRREFFYYFLFCIYKFLTEGSLPLLCLSKNVVNPSCFFVPVNRRLS